MIYITNVSTTRPPIPWSVENGFQTYQPGPRKITVTLEIVSAESLADLMFLAEREQWVGVDMLDGLK
jgi:hypothetical protein